MTDEPRAGRFVLVVDDHESIAQSIADLLAIRRRLDAIAFTTGHAALACCKVRAPLLAVLDVRMPGLDGVSLAGLLRANDPALPIVFVTGSPEDVEAARLDPPLRVVAKPCTSEEIVAAIDAMLPVVSAFG